jgi:Ca-activated chloride channel family protein
MADPVVFEALVNRENVMSSAENFVLHLLLQATAAAKGQGVNGVRLPLNLGVVIDRSGSMYDERRLEFVVEAVKFLVDNLEPDDRVAIVAFADQAHIVAAGDQIRDKAAVKRAIDDIDMLEIGGGTQMALGMKAAIEEVKKNLAASRLNRVLVLTDGQTYEEMACLELARANKAQMSFSAMGVGAEFNEKLLMQVAQETGGKYHYIGDSAQIPQIFEDELQGLRAVTARNGRFDLALSQGVQIREAFRASPEIYSLGEPLLDAERKISYAVGDLEGGVPASILLSLVLPPRKPGVVRLARAAFHYELPGVGERELAADVTVNYTLDRALASKANGRVMNLVDQVAIAKLQAKAEEEFKQGNVDRATKLLTNAIASTQKVGNVKATQALSGFMEQIKKTQTLESKAAKTTLLQAQAVVRKTQMLDPEALKELKDLE